MEIGGGPVASCSKEQQKIYQQWLAVADSDGDGRITGSDATKFFAMSNLSRSELKKVWALADTLRLGYLGFSEFISAMQLVSLAKSGHELTPDLEHSNLEEIKIPEMEGLDALFAKKKAVTTYVPELNGSSQAQSSPTAGWFTAKSKKVPLSAVTSIVEGLKRLYIEKLKPLETTYLFHDFVSPALTNSDLDAKPMVMLLEQYSTGKTTFIKHMLKCEYPGAHIGPEPTTDRFVCVMSGPDERTVPGNTIAVQADMPFSGLSNFGGAFLSKFQCSQMPHPLLEHITFVDTPGLLSGENQRTTQTYDFTGVISWFAAKCDLILLLFDPHKLDISDEFKRVISSLRGHDDKIRVVLNKAGQIDTQQLMREYGALKWSLGKVLNTPEVVRVYIGSFNDKPINDEDIGPMVKELFEREQSDLLADLKDIPKKACDRRINEFVERARAAKIHAYIISHLRKEMPDMMGKSKTQKRLIDNLEDEFAKVQREHHLPAGDFPYIEHFREILNGYSFDKFQKLKPKMIQAVDDMLGYDIPDLLNNFRYPYEGIAAAFPPPEPDLSLLLTLALPLPPPPPPSQIKCEVQKEMIFYAYLPLGPSPPDPPSSALLRGPHRGVCGDPFWTVICALHSRAYELASLAEGQAAKERVRAEKYRRELSAKLNFTIYILLGLCGVSLIWAVAEGCGAYKVYKAYQYSREIFYFYKRLYDRSWVRHLVNKLV